MLRVVHIGEPITRLGLDKAAQPHARTKNEFRITRLIASGARRERRQQRPIAAVKSDAEVRQSQFAQGAAQLPQRRNGRISFGRLSKRVVAEIETPGFQVGPRNAGAGQETLEPILLKGAPVEDAVGGVNVRDQPILNQRPVLSQSLQRREVDWRASVFHGGGGGHVTAAKQGAR